eukprot:gene7292-6867_t
MYGNPCLRKKSANGALYSPFLTETIPGALKINEARAELGSSPLEFIKIDFASPSTDSGDHKMSSTHIRE